MTNDVSTRPTIDDDIEHSEELPGELPAAPIAADEDYAQYFTEDEPAEAAPTDVADHDDTADEAGVMSAPVPAPPKIIMLPIEKLRPNPFNPNEQTAEQFAENVAEVRRLGRIPKPIVVRPAEDGFEIIDGEHAWRAAQDVGLAELACEVIEADDFELMRQCYKRNRGGTDDPVRLGQMFRRMQGERNLSIRASRGKLTCPKARSAFTSTSLRPRSCAALRRQGVPRRHR